MITARFIEKDGNAVGFEISGHACFADGNDIVCASVSSAAYLTANGITEVLLCRAYASDNANGEMEFRLLENNDAARQMIRSLAFHLEHLAEDYPKNLKVFFDTEV